MTRSEPPFHSSQPVQPQTLPNTFCIYLAKQFIVKQGFQPARAPELAGLADACDVLLTFADGYSFIIVCMIDRQARPDRSRAITIDELDDIGQKCLKYTAKVRANKIQPTFLVLEIGNGWSEDQRRRLDLLRYTSQNSKIFAMAIDVASGEVSCNSTSWFAKTPYRRFIEGVLASPRETDADLARQQVAPPNLTFPIVASALMALLCAVFAAEIACGIGPTTDLLRPTIATLVAFGGLSRSLVVQSGEWYRLLSAPFLHADAAHLAFNMVGLYLAGRSLESLVGRAWFAATYAIGALGGSCLSVLLNPPNIVSVGASGAIMSLFAATLVTSFRFPPGVLRTKLRTNALYILLPSLLPLASVLQNSRNLTKVDYGAHFGGAIGGAIVGLVLLRIWPRNEALPGFRQVAAAIAITGVVALVYPAISVLQSYQAVAFTTQLIPSDKLPRTSTEMRARATQLMAQYPNDPRPHFIRAADLLDANDPAGAEREARAGLAKEDLWRRILAPQLADHLRVILAMAISGDRLDEALQTARPACAAIKDGPMRKLLDDRKLCGL